MKVFLKSRQDDVGNRAIQKNDARTQNGGDQDSVEPGWCLRKI